MYGNKTYWFLREADTDIVQKGTEFPWEGTRNTDEPENHHSVWGQGPLMDPITEVYGYCHTDASSHMMLSSCDRTVNVPFLPTPHQS